MITINARNVNEALLMGRVVLDAHGVRETSRDGPVIRCPLPVTTIYARPCERVLFSAERDANPFFHLAEALWMIAGRDTLCDLVPYVPRMARYSDDGVHQPAAYGKRWRDHILPDTNMGENGWGDQLNWVVKRLRANPNDRRVVIQMWDPGTDIPAADRGSKDVPCNLEALPWVDPEGALNLTVFCRSNDMVMGAYGANAVHFSFLLEYLAARIGVPVGRYWQISNNFHMYERDQPKLASTSASLYATGLVAPLPLFDNFPLATHLENGWTDERREAMLQEDLLIFFDHGPVEAATKARWPFLRRVAVPLALAHKHYRNGKGEDRYKGALEILQQCQASDWQWAACDWISRRYDRWNVAADSGVSNVE